MIRGRIFPFPVLTAHVVAGVEAARLLHYHAGQQEAEAGAEVVQHLTIGGAVNNNDIHNFYLQRSWT